MNQPALASFVSSPIEEERIFPANKNEPGGSTDKNIERIQSRVENICRSEGVTTDHRTPAEILQSEILNLHQQILLLREKTNQTGYENKVRRDLLLQRWKNKEISLEDFQSESGEMERLLQEDMDRIQGYESSERLMAIDLLNTRLNPDDKILRVESMNLPITLDGFLGNDVQSGGSNARGVFELTGTNLLAIEKSEKAYEFIGNLTYLTSLLGDNPRIPRTLKVFVNNGKTYQIIERAPGTQLDHLSLEEIECIPQDHFDQFVSDIRLMGEKGIVIDPSKSSNFFYDVEIGFVFIDLSGGNFQNEHLEKNLISVVLVGRSSLSVSEKIKASIGKS